MDVQIPCQPADQRPCQRPLTICVFGCDTIPKYKDEILKIQETWGSVALSMPNKVKVLFFLGEEPGELPESDQYIRLLGVKNDYLSASHKQFLGLQYCHDHFPSQFIFCCGTDTYINIPLLLKYISAFCSTTPLYIGGHGAEVSLGPSSSRKIYFHSGGAGFLLSFACVDKLYPQFAGAVESWKAICREGGAPDTLWTACDVAIAYFVQQPEIDAFVFKVCDSVFMGCNYRGIAHGYYPCHVDAIQWNKLISCHSMSLTDFDDFTRILKENDYYV